MFPTVTGKSQRLDSGWGVWEKCFLETPWARTILHILKIPGLSLLPAEETEQQVALELWTVLLSTQKCFFQVTPTLWETDGIGRLMSSNRFYRWA